MYSLQPIFGRLKVHLVDKAPDTTFWPYDESSVYLKPPSPEVDLTWKRRTEESSFRLTSPEACKMDKNPGHSSLGRWQQRAARRNIRRTSPAPPTWPWWMSFIKFSVSTTSDTRLGMIITVISASPLEITLSFQDHLLRSHHLLLQVLTCHVEVQLYTFNIIRGYRGPFTGLRLQREHHILRMC